MARAATLILLLVALVGCNGMPNLIDEVKELWSLTHQGGGDLNHWLLSDHKSDTEPFGAVITKFAVPPRKARDFVRAWKEIEEPTRKETGNYVFDLKKVALDNVLFYEYAEYANKSAYMQHLFSDYMKDFIKTVADMDIYTELIPTVNIKTEQGPDSNAVLRDVDFRDKPFFIVIDYMVPPSESMEFIRQFREFQVKVSEEEGVKMHALHKTLTDNVSYKVYGAWETLQDYWNHVTGEPMREQFKFNAERGIVTDAKPLIKIGNEPEA